MSSLENYQAGLARDLPFFRGKELLTVQALAYFKPITTPDETLINANSLQETITVDPITNLVEVKGICAFVDGSGLPRYDKPYRIVNTTEASKARLKQIVNKEITSFSAYNINARTTFEVPFITSIKSEHIKEIIDVSLQPLTEYTIYSLTPAETTKTAFVSRGAKVGVCPLHQSTRYSNTDKRSYHQFNLYHGQTGKLILSTGGLPAVDNPLSEEADLAIWFHRYRYVFVPKVTNLGILIDGINSKAFYTTSTEDKLAQNGSVTVVDLNGKFVIENPRTNPGAYSDDGHQVTDEDFTYLHADASNEPTYTKQMSRYNADIKPTYIQFTNQYIATRPLDIYKSSNVFGGVEIEDANLLLLNSKQIPVRYAVLDDNGYIDCSHGINDVMIKLKGGNTFISYRDHLRRLGALDKFRELTTNGPVSVLIGVGPSDTGPLGGGDYDCRLMAGCTLTKEKVDILHPMHNTYVYKRRDSGQWVFVVKDTRQLRRVGNVRKEDGNNVADYHLFLSKRTTGAHALTNEDYGIPFYLLDNGYFSFGQSIWINVEDNIIAEFKRLSPTNASAFEGESSEELSNAGITFQEISSPIHLPDAVRRLPEWRNYDSEQGMFGIIFNIPSGPFRNAMNGLNLIGFTRRVLNVTKYNETPKPSKMMIYASKAKNTYQVYD